MQAFRRGGGGGRTQEGGAWFEELVRGALWIVDTSVLFSAAVGELKYVRSDVVRPGGKAAR